MTTPTDGRRYVVVTLEDAHTIASALSRTGAHRGGLRDQIGEDESARLGRIYDRLVVESGADMQEIVDTVASLPVCAACCIEGQEQSCQVWPAQKQGRRLRRLLERARGER
jgi:hypothetical protein